MSIPHSKCGCDEKKLQAFPTFCFPTEVDPGPVGLEWIQFGRRACLGKRTQNLLNQNSGQSGCYLALEKKLHKL